MADGYTIMARLGLDTKGFSQGLASANQEARRHGTEIDRAAGAHEKLFTSSHRVASRIGNLSEQLLRGGDAASVFASGIEAAERSLNLPLGSLAILAGVAALAQQIVETKKKAKELREEIEKLERDGQQNPRFQTLEALKSQAEEATKKIKELQKEKGLFQNSLDYVGSSHLLGGSGFDEVLKERAENIDKAKKALEKARSKEAAKAEESNDIESLRQTQGDFAAEREKIKKERDEKAGLAIERIRNGEGTAADVDLQRQANREADIALRAVDRKEAAAKREVELQRQLIDIKQKGQDVDIKSAQARMAAAKEEMHAATSEGVGAATNKYLEAAKELEDAVRKKDSSRRDVSLEEQLTRIKREGYDVDIRSAQAKLEYAKAAEAAAKADEKSAAAAKVQAAVAELLEAKRKKYPSLGEEAGRQALAGEYQSLLAEQTKPVTNADEAREFKARSKRISEIERQLPANPKTLKADQDIQDEIDALNSKGGKYGEFLTPEELSRKNELERQKFSRAQGARTPEEIAAQNEINAIDYAGAHQVSGLSPQQKARREELEQGLFGSNRAGEGPANKLDAAAEKLDKAADKLETALTNQ